MEAVESTFLFSKRVCSLALHSGPRPRTFSHGPDLMAPQAQRHWSSKVPGLEKRNNHLEGTPLQPASAGASAGLTSFNKPNFGQCSIFLGPRWKESGFLIENPQGTG